MQLREISREGFIGESSVRLVPTILIFPTSKPSDPPPPRVPFPLFRDITSYFPAFVSLQRHLAGRSYPIARVSVDPHGYHVLTLSLHLTSHLSRRLSRGHAFLVSSFDTLAHRWEEKGESAGRFTTRESRQSGLWSGDVSMLLNIALLTNRVFHGSSRESSWLLSSSRLFRQGNLSNRNS